VSSKQTKINFGSNRNKPKQDLFRVCFGLFRETKNKVFRFVSVFRNNRNKQNCFETNNRNKPKRLSRLLWNRQPEAAQSCQRRDTRQHMLLENRRVQRPQAAIETQTSSKVCRVREQVRVSPEAANAAVGQTRPKAA
jgi:hypothetical protein